MRTSIVAADSLLFDGATKYAAGLTCEPPAQRRAPRRDEPQRCQELSLGASLSGGLTAQSLQKTIQRDPSGRRRA